MDTKKTKKPKDFRTKPCLYVSDYEKNSVGGEFDGYMSIRDLKKLIKWCEEVIEYFGEK